MQYQTDVGIVDESNIVSFSASNVFLGMDLTGTTIAVGDDWCYILHSFRSSVGEITNEWTDAGKHSFGIVR